MLPRSVIHVSHPDPSLPIAFRGILKQPLTFSPLLSSSWRPTHLPLVSRINAMAFHEQGRPNQLSFVDGLPLHNKVGSPFKEITFNLVITLDDEPESPNPSVELSCLDIQWI